MKDTLEIIIKTIFLFTLIGLGWIVEKILLLQTIAVVPLFLIGLHKFGMTDKLAEYCLLYSMIYMINLTLYLLYVRFIRRT